MSEEEYQKQKNRLLIALRIFADDFEIVRKIQNRLIELLRKRNEIK